MNTFARMTFALALLGASLCAAAQPVRIEGAGALEPLARAAVDEYLKARRGALAIELGVSGTGGAIARLCRGEIDLAHATRPMRADEIEACAQAKVEFIELPIAFDAVTLVVHARNRFVSSLTVEELRKIWEAAAQGRVTRWNQVNPAWPDWPLTLLGPDRQSDEGRYFNAAILGPGRPPRADTMASAQDEVLIQGVARSAYALGYVSLGAYLKHRAEVKAVPVSAGAGVPPVAASVEAIAQGAYQPLARPLFVYVSAKSLARPEVRDYVEFLLGNAPRLARSAHYAPLADAAYRRELERVRAPVTGSAWGGAVPVGLTLEALQKKYGLL